MTDSDRLSHIEQKLDRLAEQVGEWRREMAVDVDRLKQAEASRVWWMRAVATASVAALATSIKSLIFK